MAADVNTHAPDADALHEIRAVVSQAKKGDTTVLPRLRELLDAYPILWRRYGDLAAQAERLWVALVAGADHYLRECLSREADALRRELAGPDAGPVELLLVGRVVMTWVQVHYFDAVTAQATAQDESPKLAAYRATRQAQAHRNYLSSLAALATLRRLLPRQLRIPSPPPADSHAVDRGGDAALPNGHAHGGLAVDSKAGVPPHNRIVDLLVHLDAEGLAGRASASCGAGRDGGSRR
jgi:hypothetical protein